MENTKNGYPFRDFLLSCFRDAYFNFFDLSYWCFMSDTLSAVDLTQDRFGGGYAGTQRGLETSVADPAARKVKAFYRGGDYRAGKRTNPWCGIRNRTQRRPDAPGSACGSSGVPMSISSMCCRMLGKISSARFSMAFGAAKFGLVVLAGGMLSQGSPYLRVTRLT